MPGGIGHSSLNCDKGAHVVTEFVVDILSHFITAFQSQNQVRSQNNRGSLAIYSTNFTYSPQQIN